jgi:hypothetical protein
MRDSQPCTPSAELASVRPGAGTGSRIGQKLGGASTSPSCGCDLSHLQRGQIQFRISSFESKMRQPTALLLFVALLAAASTSVDQAATPQMYRCNSTAGTLEHGLCVEDPLGNQTLAECYANCKCIPPRNCGQLNGTVQCGARQGCNVCDNCCKAFLTTADLCDKCFASPPNPLNPKEGGCGDVAPTPPPTPAPPTPPPTPAPPTPQPTPPPPCGVPGQNQTCPGQKCCDINGPAGVVGRVCIDNSRFCCGEEPSGCDTQPNCCTYSAGMAPDYVCLTASQSCCMHGPCPVPCSPSTGICPGSQFTASHSL